MTMAKLKKSKRRKNPTGPTLLTKPSRPKEQEGWKYKTDLHNKGQIHKV
jgi:hypothetical protein